jgi:hypothetical protein
MMRHRVAIRAHRPQIPNWVEPVARCQLRELFDVLDVDEPFHHRAVRGDKVEFADGADRPMMTDAVFSRVGIV